MFDWFRKAKYEWVEAYNAALRGDVRISSASRGRIYAKPEELEGYIGGVDQVIRVKGKAVGKIVGMKVYKVDLDQTWEVEPETGKILAFYDGDVTRSADNG